MRWGYKGGQIPRILWDRFCPRDNFNTAAVTNAQSWLNLLNFSIGQLYFPHPNISGWFPLKTGGQAGDINSRSVFSFPVQLFKEVLSGKVCCFMQLVFFNPDAAHCPFLPSQPSLNGSVTDLHFVM